jgi:hypothetical protein
LFSVCLPEDLEMWIFQTYRLCDGSGKFLLPARCHPEALPMNMPENAPLGITSQLKLDAHWMPYTANRSFQRDPRIIIAAKGSWLTDDQGRQIYDSLSGLWTCGAGHTRVAPAGRSRLFAGFPVRPSAVVPAGGKDHRADPG